MRIGYVVRACSASLSVLLFGQACGASRATVAATPEMPIWREEGEFTIGAEIVTEGAGEHTVIGVRLLVVSRASRPVTLRRDRIVLELPDGSRLRPAGLAGVAGPPPQGAAGGAGVAQMCVTLALCAVAGVVLVVMLAGAAARPAAEAAYVARLQEYEATSFPAVAELETGQRAHGFVYFRLAEAGATSTTVRPGGAVARAGTFAEESGRSWDYTPPPPALRAVVANMAGAAPRTSVLHLEIEDGAGAPTAGGQPGIAHLRVPFSR
jgi:hypothetical protein